MRKVVLAELLLSLVMPRDRASATAGDLLESSRGRLSFLWSVAGTMLSATFRQVSILSMLRAVAWTIAFSLLLRTVFGGVLLAGGRAAPELSWLGPILGVVYLLLHPILVGFWMARRLPGREVAAWFAVVFAVVVVTTLWWWRLPGLMEHAILSGVFAPASLLPLLVGVLLARRKELRAQRTAV